MKANEIVIVSLKLLGIYILVEGLGSLGTSIGINSMNRFSDWSLFLGTFIFLISGLILIFRAEYFSKLLFKFADEPLGKFEVSENFQKGALRIIGIYVAIFICKDTQETLNDFSPSFTGLNIVALVVKESL